MRMHQRQSVISALRSAGGETVRPFFSARGHPDEHQVVNNLSKRNVLWNDDETRTVVRTDEFTEVYWHRGLVVSHRNAVVPCGHVGIPETCQTSDRRGSEVDLTDPSDDGGDDDLVEVRVWLKANPHRWASGVSRFASASFR
jgi:hypothetical protein